MSCLIPEIKILKNLSFIESHRTADMLRFKCFSVIYKKKKTRNNIISQKKLTEFLFF